MTSVIRAAVSKKKKRFIESGFNLDLTYVTPRIIAMGFPSTGVEAVYRNPMPEVQRFFKTRHEGHYKIYNLCSERQYNLTEYFEHVERFPFDDHNPCPLDLIEPFCKSVDQFFAESSENVIAVHCKAGKGRTGLMICCYLVHSGICPNPIEAMKMFATERTHNCKGVTIPSQMRLVHYYARMRMLEKEMLPLPKARPFLITHVRLVGVPKFDSVIFAGGGSNPYFRCQVQTKVDTLQWTPKTIYDYKKVVGEKFICHHSADEPQVDLDCSTHNLKVRGDVKLIFYNLDSYQKDQKIFHLWFNTAFVENNFLCFGKAVVDKANKDKHCKHYPKNFQVQIFFHPLPEDDDHAYIEISDDEHGSQDEDTDEDEEDYQQLAVAPVTESPMEV